MFDFNIVGHIYGSIHSRTSFSAKLLYLKVELRVTANKSIISGQILIKK